MVDIAGCCARAASGHAAAAPPSRLMNSLRLMGLTRVRGALKLRGGSLGIKEFCGKGRVLLWGAQGMLRSVTCALCITAQSRRLGSFPLLSSAARF